MEEIIKGSRAFSAGQREELKWLEACILLHNDVVARSAGTYSKPKFHPSLHPTLRPPDAEGGPDLDSVPSRPVVEREALDLGRMGQNSFGKAVAALCWFKMANLCK